MGKHLKTKIDYDMINDLSQELSRLDPTNKKLNKYLEMDNFEGAELRKHLKQFPWSDKIPEIHSK